MYMIEKALSALAALSVGVGFGFSTPIAVAQVPSQLDPVVACDAVAAHPDDPDSIGQGRVKAEIDLPKAIEICQTASETQPDNLRIRYQYARMLFYSGERHTSLIEMKSAADDGYRQAQFVYGVFVNYQRKGAPADLCIAEKYWNNSASQGRQAAIVNYLKERLKDRFKNCTNMASFDQMKKWLEVAETQSKNYYETLFIKDLSERLVIKNAINRESIIE